MNGFATYVPSDGYIPDEDDQDDFVMVDDKISMAPVENTSPSGRRKRRIIRRPAGEYGSFLKGLKSMFRTSKDSPRKTDHRFNGNFSYRK
jgi:hypothetical protein